MTADRKELEKIIEQCIEKRLPQAQSNGFGAELRHQRELMEKRYEAADKRYEESRSNMNQRYEAADKRYEESRFDTNRRFEESRSNMNQRFEMLIFSMDKRFEAADKRSNFMQWMMIASFGLMSLLMSLYKFIP